MIGYQYYRILFTLGVIGLPVVYFDYVFVALPSIISCMVLYRLIVKITEQHVDTNGRGVFITGCDTGEPTTVIT